MRCGAGARIFVETQALNFSSELFLFPILYHRICCRSFLMETGVVKLHKYFVDCDCAECFETEGRKWYRRIYFLCSVRFLWRGGARAK